MKGIRIDSIPFTEFGQNAADVAMEEGLLDETFTEEMQHCSYGLSNGEFYFVPTDDSTVKEWLRELHQFLTFKGCNGSFCDPDMPPETLEALVENIKFDDEWLGW